MARTSSNKTSSTYISLFHIVVQNHTNIGTYSSNKITHKAHIDNARTLCHHKQNTNWFHLLSENAIVEFIFWCFEKLIRIRYTILLYISSLDMSSILYLN